MNEFVCPDGTMSVNGVCRMFMTPGERESLKVSPTKSIEDIPISQGTIPKTDMFSKTPETITSSKTPQILDTKKFVDEYKSKEASASNIDKVIDSVNNVITPIKNKISQVPKGFDFDFEQVKEVKDSADNIITANTEYYNNYVENKLGIPTNVQEALRFGSALYGVTSGGGLMAAAGPFAVPFVLGGALKSKANKEQQALINRESTRDLQNRIDAGQFGSNVPTPQEDRRSSQYNKPSAPAKTFSAPQQTSGIGGLHNYG